MPSVLIGIPQHGNSLSTATMRSVHSAVIGSRANVGYQAMGLSLLARNFSSLWVSAYKRGADYFILHHSDLGVESPYPGISWVDLLIDRMRLLNAAVISVASPIKSQFGHFSSGLLLKANNPYTLRRTTARELLHLPTEFISRVDLCRLYDVHPVSAGAMLINTGLMIIDLRRFPWAKIRWPGFNIVDSIQWSLNDVPCSYTIPEDWNFSQWLYEHHFPYYMTKELILDHHGGKTYYNQGLWGDLHDDTPVQPSIEEWRGMVV